MSTDDPDVLPGDSFPPVSGISAAEQAAACWLARLCSGEASDEDRSAFAHWRAEDAANAAAFDAMRVLWGELDRVPAVAIADVSAVPAGASVRRPRRSRRVRGWALAASVLLALGAAHRAATDWRYDAVTASGERRSLELADDSRIVLSGDTALDIAVDAQVREIRLARGEVWIDVAAGDARPFMVRAADAEVRVTGTRFAVRRVTEELRVVVEHGSVEVHARGGRVVVGADQRVTLHDGVPSPVATTDAARDLAWQRGRLVLSDATLEEILRELDPHHAGTVLIANDALRTLRLNAVIDLARIDDWLATLGESGSIRVTRLGPLIVLR